MLAATLRSGDLLHSGPSLTSLEARSQAPSLRSNEHDALVARFHAMFIRLARCSQARFFHATGGFQATIILPAVPAAFIARAMVRLTVARGGIVPKLRRASYPPSRWNNPTVPTGVVHALLRSTAFARRLNELNPESRNRPQRSFPA